MRALVFSEHPFLEGKDVRILLVGTVVSDPKMNRSAYFTFLALEKDWASPISSFSFFTVSPGIFGAF